MPNYKVTLFFDGNRIDAVKKKIAQVFGEDATVYVDRVVAPSSRADRYSSAESSLEDCKSEVQSLHDELEEWLDNLPENLQSGSKADELREAIDSLDELINELEGISWPDVAFPGMF